MRIWPCPSQGAQLVKNLPAVQETLVKFLGWEGLLQRYRLPAPVFSGFPDSSAGKRRATHSSILAWRMSWTEESGRLEYMGS